MITQGQMVDIYKNECEVKTLRRGLHCIAHEEVDGREGASRNTKGKLYYFALLHCLNGMSLQTNFPRQCVIVHI